MRKKFVYLLGLVMLLAVALPACSSQKSAMATTPPIRADIVSKAGDKVLLQNSGSAQAKESFCPNEIVTAYRYTPDQLNTEPTGRLRLSSFIGDRFTDAFVVDGDVKPGDVVMKASAECLTQQFPTVQ
jgi:hypothetical protein